MVTAWLRAVVEFTCPRFLPYVMWTSKRRTSQSMLENRSGNVVQTRRFRALIGSCRIVRADRACRIAVTLCRFVPELTLDQQESGRGAVSMLGESLLYEPRDSGRDREACGQAGRFDARGLDQTWLIRIGPNEEIRERLVRCRELWSNAGAAVGEV